MGSKKALKSSGKNVFLVCALLERWLILGSFLGGSKLGLGRKLGRNWAAWHLVSVYTCLLLNKETDSRATTEEEKDADNNLVDALTKPDVLLGTWRKQNAGHWQQFHEINGSFLSSIYIKLCRKPNKVCCYNVTELPNVLFLEKVRNQSNLKTCT